MTTQYLSVKDVASTLGVSEMTVTRLIQGGELEAVRVRRSLKIPQVGLDDYLRRAAVRPQESSTQSHDTPNLTNGDDR